MAVAFDAVGPSSSGQDGTSPQTWTHVCGGSANYLLVFVGDGAAGASATYSVTYNGVAMTELDRQLGNNNAGGGLTLAFGLANPATGSNTVSVTRTSGGTSPMGVGSMSYSGVGSVGTPVKAAGASTTPSVTVSSSSGNMVAAGMHNLGGSFTGANQTLRFRVTYDTVSATQAEDAAGSASVTLTGTTVNDWWAIIGVELQAGGGAPTPSPRPKDYFAPRRNPALQRKARWRILEQGTTASAAASGGTGSITLSGAGAAGATTAGTGSLTLSGAGSATAPASGSGSLTLTGSGTDAGAATGSGSLTLSGAGSDQASATGSGSLSLNGSGSATAPASGTGSITLNGSGTTPGGGNAASGSGSLSLNGSGTATAPATGSGSISLNGAATATAPASGTGSITLNGTGTIGASSSASGTGSITLSGTGTDKGAATGSGTLTLAGAGGVGVLTVGSGAIILAGAGAIAARAGGTAQLVLNGSGFATGPSNVISGRILVAEPRILTALGEPRIPTTMQAETRLLEATGEPR